MKRHYSSSDELSNTFPKTNHLTISISDFPIFDGISMTFRLFLDDFEDLAHVANLSNNVKLALLPTRLMRRPKWFYRRLDNGRKKTYELAVESLKEIFDYPQQQYPLQRKLHRIKQNDYSSLADYIETIEKLFTELRTKPEYQLGFFLAGLDIDLQNFLMLENVVHVWKCCQIINFEKQHRRKTNS